jgi:hypothetical protein
MERLHATGELVLLQLLKYHYPLSPSSIVTYREILFIGITEVTKQANIASVPLLLEIANQISWADLFDNESDRQKFCKQVKGLLFERSMSKSSAMNQLSGILALWITFSMKFCLLCVCNIKI